MRILCQVTIAQIKIELFCKEGKVKTSTPVGSIDLYFYYFLQRASTSNKTRLLVVRCLLLIGDTTTNLANEESPSFYIQLTNEQLCKQYKALRYINRLQSLNINMKVRSNLTLLHFVIPSWLNVFHIKLALKSLLNFHKILKQLNSFQKFYSIYLSAFCILKDNL